MTQDNLLLKGVYFDGRTRDILILDGKFADIDCKSFPEGTPTMDCSTLAIAPSFYNTHNHAAMTLMRGYADDLPLETWLQEHIWPFEAKMTPADIRKGSEIAAAEMIDSGTVFFNDMYFEIDQTIDVVNKTGMRAAIGITVMDNHNLSQTAEKKEFIRNFKDPSGGRISLVMAPHSVYCVGREKLIKCAQFARDNGLKLHIHVAETCLEVQNCIKATGMTPVEYLDSIGFLGPDVIAAHCVHLVQKDWDIMAKRGVTVAHCPCSNMKLGSGRFPYEMAIKSGVRITIGTDGASSNNNLDLLEEVKFASLLAKSVTQKPDGSIDNMGDPSILPVDMAMKWATRNAAEFFGINAGEIKAGMEADFLLFDLKNPKFTPLHNLTSDIAYSADSSCIAASYCRGRRIK